jgi:RNA polymerase sigma factor (sigma-70 family)
MDPRGTFDRIVSRHYESLHRVAAALLRRDSSGITLQAGDLLNTACRRMLEGTWALAETSEHLRGQIIWKMRHILLDRARSRRVHASAGYMVRVPLDDSLPAATGICDPMELREAVEQLRREPGWGPRAARLIDLRYYDGHTVEDAAAAVGLRRESAHRELRRALDWLRERMGK